MSGAVPGKDVVDLSFGREATKPDIFRTACQRFAFVVIEMVNAETLRLRVDEHLQKLVLALFGEIANLVEE
jgi:hypothetical protein